MEIRGKRVLITGGAVRVGRAIVEDLVCRGAHVTVQYHRSSAAASELTSDCCEAVCVDLHSSGMAEQLFAYGPFDILINNAAAYNRKSLMDEDDAVAREQFEINYWVPYRLTKAFAAQGRGGCIVNVLDSETLCPVAPGSAYGLSKKALADFTLLSARELAPAIRVNAVAPGPLMPPIDNPAAQLREVTARMPLGRPPTLEEFTQTIVFLIENDTLTGQIISVDSGLHLN